ncbi:Condensin II complex subunit H2 [Spironucleus salmonicida]|uniref:Condensin II complex subunit H2 n=1 Tax=Spironucleus salmonicida TaxID=348837 RepID=V6LW92_9EUKA|nr:Condensin II complex subunit H2 [Spironucleus salmonicida]KAH0575130.1 Condensin II complex subunit H2 [Spironucleus salmonicida]|eukprot:EST48897.1 hypothetical protein SS50377_10868 [Spironucleus salmonicida]
MSYFVPSQTSQLHQISDLLRPIKDLSDAWQIDLEPYIEDFYSTFTEDEIPDFRDAAALVLGASSIFARKVDFLYDQLQAALIQNSRNQKPSRRKSLAAFSGQNIIIDYIASPQEYDLTSYFEQFQQEPTEDLCLLPRDPQTSLCSRTSLETQNYKISPVFSAIQQQQLLVFEHWDTPQLYRALNGDVKAGPTLFSTPLNPKMYEQMSRLVGAEKSVIAPQQPLPPSALSSQPDSPPGHDMVQPSENSDPGEGPDDINLDELSFHAILDIATESIADQMDTLFQKIQGFCDQKAAKVAAAKPFQLMRPNEILPPRQDVRIGNYVFVGELAGLDYQERGFDYDLVALNNTDAFVTAGTFYSDSVHSATAKKAIFGARQVVSVEQDQASRQAEQTQGSQIQLDFEIPKEPLVQRQLQKGSGFVYRKIINHDYLFWKKSTIVSTAPFDIQEVTKAVLDQSGEKVLLRQLSKNRRELSQNFMGALLLASQGKCEIIDEGERGIFVLRKD